MNQLPGSLVPSSGIPSLIRRLGAKARIAALCVLGCSAACSPALAQTATTTTLAITSGGSHSYNAVFVGTPNSSTTRTSSSSANLALTVSAPAQYPSITAMSVAGSTGSYQLGATVSGIGSAPPTGTVSFLDTTNGNAQLGTASLSIASSSFGLANVSNPATGTCPTAIAVAERSAGNLIAGGLTFAEIHRRRTQLYPIGGSHHHRHRSIIVCTRLPSTLIIHPQLARSNSFRLILRWKRSSDLTCDLPEGFSCAARRTSLRNTRKDYPWIAPS